MPRQCAGETPVVAHATVGEQDKCCNEFYVSHCRGTCYELMIRLLYALCRSEAKFNLFCVAFVIADLIGNDNSLEYKSKYKSFDDKQQVVFKKHKGVFKITLG